MIHQRLFVNITGVTLILQHLSDFLSKSSCLLSWNATGKVIFNFLLVSVRVLSPGADAIPRDTLAILWHQVISSLEYLYRTFYGAFFIRVIATYLYNVCCVDNCDKCILQSSSLMVASSCSLRVLLKVSQPKPCIHLSCLSYVLHFPLISYFSI